MNTKRDIWRNLLSIQNEAVSLVTMRSKELWLVQENHATVKPYSSLAPRGTTTYSESIIELRNLQTLINIMKMLEKSNQFLSSEQPFEPKSLDVALNIAENWKITIGKLVVAFNLEGIWFEFWMKEALVTKKFLSFVVGNSQTSLI